jgi:hypothetical protein
MITKDQLLENNGKLFALLESSVSKIVEGMVTKTMILIEVHESDLSKYSLVSPIQVVNSVSQPPIIKLLSV